MWRDSTRALPETQHARNSWMRWCCPSRNAVVELMCAISVAQRGSIGTDFPIQSKKKKEWAVGSKAKEAVVCSWAAELLPVAAVDTEIVNGFRETEFVIAKSFEAIRAYLAQDVRVPQGATMESGRLVEHECSSYLCVFSRLLTLRSFWKWDSGLPAYLIWSHTADFMFCSPLVIPFQKHTAKEGGFRQGEWTLDTEHLGTLCLDRP